MLAFSPSHIQVPLSEGHRFPMGKYALLAQAMRQEGWKVEKAPPASLVDLALVHEVSYLEAWRQGTLEAKAIRKLGLPYSPELFERSLASVGGTLAAFKHARREGYGVNLAGGTHHAFAGHGEGFCVFNDLAMVARRALQEGFETISIIDLDVHQGNGTAKILAHEPRAFTLSLHGAKNYPFHKEQSDLDVALPDAIHDSDYLKSLAEALEKLPPKPQLILYQAGVDVLQGDKLGRMRLSFEGLAKRDQMVYNYAKGLGVPLVYTMGGGYQADIQVTVAAHIQSLKLLAQYHS
ncbi:MAG: histone deacetylase [Deinococcales bacterium]